MVKIVGKRRITFKDRKDPNGKIVDGFKVYTVMEDPTDHNLDGVICDSVFVDPDVFCRFFDVPLGTYVEIFYNKYGRPIGCTVLERS